MEMTIIAINYFDLLLLSNWFIFIENVYIFYIKIIG